MSEKSLAAEPAMSRKNDADLQQRRPKRDENQMAADRALVFKCPKCWSTLGAGVDFAIPPPPGLSADTVWNTAPALLPSNLSGIRSKHKILAPFLAALGNGLAREHAATARRRIKKMPQKSEFQIISGDQTEVQAQLNQLAAQNWRPILMTAANAPAGITVFVILEGIMSGWEQR